MKSITVLCGKYNGNSSDDWQSSDECTTEATSTHEFTHDQQHNYTPRPVPANIPCKLYNHINKGNVGNYPGKKFTGILLKSRFFGRKWLNILLGEAKMGLNELYVGITQQERSAIPMPPSKWDYDGILEITNYENEISNFKKISNIDQRIMNIEGKKNRIRMDYRLRGNDRGFGIYCSSNVPLEGGNQSGKNFTRILPKSRFFGRKWLNNMLGGAKMKK